jgi:hypothetical protein
MRPRANHLHPVTASEGHDAGAQGCRSATCVEAPLWLGFCRCCLARYRECGSPERERDAEAVARIHDVADVVAEALSASAPLVYAGVSAATRRALRVAAVEVVLQHGSQVDVVSSALATLLVETRPWRTGDRATDDHSGRDHIHGRRDVSAAICDGRRWRGAA